MTVLAPDLLLRAYALGVFPMAASRGSAELRWIDPQRRAVFPLEGFHVSRSLARQIRRLQPEVRVDQDFAGVVRACAAREETWINDGIFEAYLALHRLGWAHSVEVRAGGRLIGGVYGVRLGAAFFGESMFSHETGGSKMALTFLVHRLVAGGFRLFDVQFLTDHLASLGAVEISRGEYQRRLKAALAVEADWVPAGYAPGAETVLAYFGRSQPRTQTS